MTRILNPKDTLKAIDLVSNQDNFALLEEFCPNPTAYACDRRRQRIFEVKRRIFLNPFIDMTYGDRLVIVDGGNIAAGEEPEAWIVR